MFGYRFRLLRQLAGLAVAIAVIFAIETSEPLSAAANPPTKPAPTPSNPFVNWLNRFWKQYVPKPLPKQGMPKQPAKQFAGKAKPMAMKAAPAPQRQPNVKQGPNAANAVPVQAAPAPKQAPSMKTARTSLTDAWLLVNAADGLPTRKKTAALTSINKALVALGGANLKPNAAGKNGNSLADAEGLLLQAQDAVLQSKSLPLALKQAVLAEIANAQVSIKIKANAAAGKAAPPKR